MAGTRPTKFGPGEACSYCVYFKSGYCTRFHWVVKAEDWCSEYKALPSHKLAFKAKEKREREAGKI